MKRRTLKNVVMYILVLFTVGVFLVPLFFIVTTSVKSYADIMAGNPLFFTPTPENYFNVLFLNPTTIGFNFPNSLFNSLVIALAATLGALAIGFPAAYATARLGTGGGNLISYIVSLRLLPPIIFALPLYLFFFKVSPELLIDSHAGMILIYATFNIPLSVLVLRSFIVDIPPELEESAMIDGCSRLGAMLRVVLPLSAPGLIAIAILDYLAIWNEYLFALIFTSQRAVMVNVSASLFVTAYAIRYGEIAATVVIAMLPTIAFMLLVQRSLVKGLTLGAVKG